MCFDLVLSQLSGTTQKPKSNLDVLPTLLDGLLVTRSLTDHYSQQYLGSCDTPPDFTHYIHRKLTRQSNYPEVLRVTLPPRIDEH
jgi:hypothetical protein